MDKQKIFNDVATHLLTQGVQSSEAQEGGYYSYCKYRGPNGTKCAIGALLPDELYNPAMEGMSASATELAPFHKLVDADARDMWTDDMKFLRKLQAVHDTDNNWWAAPILVSALKRAADEFSVDPSILDTITPSPKFAERATKTTEQAAA